MNKKIVANTDKQNFINKPVSGWRAMRELWYLDKVMKAGEGYNPCRLLEAYQSIPKGYKTDTIKEFMLRKGWLFSILPKLYLLIPEHQKDRDTTYKVIYSCSHEKPNELINVYGSIPGKLKDKKLTIEAIKKCNIFDVNRLYNLMPKELKEDKEILVALMNHGNVYEVFNIYKSLPEILQKNRELTLIALKMSPKNLMFELYAIIPEELKDESITREAIHHAFGDVGKLFALIPEHLKYLIDEERCSLPEFFAKFMIV